MIIYKSTKWGFLYRLTLKGLVREELPSSPYDLSFSINRVMGFDFPQLLHFWMISRYPRGCWVVLYDINPEKKNSSFWKALPEDRAKTLLKDIVILKCKDASEVTSLCQSIDSDFASSIGWVNGNLIDWNWE